VVHFDENQVTGPFFLEEPTVAGDTFLAMMDNTALHHVHMETVFQLVHITSSIVFMLFGEGVF
jgi:hypothetical protein